MMDIPKKFKDWADDLKILHDYVESHHLCLQYVDYDYQVCKITGDNIRLVIYPHRTSANNYHLRIRDEGSKDKVKFQKVADDLYRISGFNCTFKVKQK